MKEREEHKELIQQIAERLRNHAEPYKEGAWERFAAVYGKPRRRLWPYWSAAAVLLAAVGLYWTMQQLDGPSVEPQVAQQTTKPPSIAPLEADQHKQEQDSVRGETVMDDPAVPAHSTNVERLKREDKERRLAGRTQTVAPEIIPVEGVAGERGSADQASRVSAGAVDTVSTPDPAPHRLASAVEGEVTEQPADDIPGHVVPNKTAVDQDAYAMASPKRESSMEKWDLGLVVSPSLTSEAVTIGGGLAVAYRISDKFSIGSGISVAQLGVGENPNYQPGHNVHQQDMAPLPSNSFDGKSAAAVNYTREVSVTSSVVTLDIPLDIRYDVVKGFYTSVGLSYVTVLNERRTSHVIDRLNKNTFVNGNASNAGRLASTEFVYSSEKVADQPLRGNGYAGFMNFSVGKKLPISTKLSLSIEPYFKLPIGRLSKEEMNFTNGGIRIVTGF